MPEWRQILELWRQAQAAGEEVCLVTVVRTEGSSYRKAGARMLLTRGGRRTGTISGGCLEAEIQKKAWWLCREGPAVECYRSSFENDESEIPYGLACGGTIWVLLEQGEAAARVLEAIAECVEDRVDIAIASCIGDQIPGGVGTRSILRRDGGRAAQEKSPKAEWTEPMRRALAEERSRWVEGVGGLVFVEYMAPPQRLFVFGAGDDAQPLVEFAHALGWWTAVVDGRSNLAIRARFPLADLVFVAGAGDHAIERLAVGSRDAVVIMTHSYEQDRRFLGQVLPLEPGYLGVLGPQHRTDWLLPDIADTPASRDLSHRIHSPAGLDIGAEGPAAVALSIVAGIQNALTKNRKGQSRDAAQGATLAT